MEVTLDAAFAQHGFEHVGRAVVSDNAHQARCRAEGGQVDRNVSGAAGPVVGFGDVHDGDRRLGRYPSGRTEQVLVKHYIARDEYTGPGEIWDRESHARNVADTRECL